MRVIGFASGSGNTLWQVLDLQKRLEATSEGAPFEVVGLFSDSEGSKAEETAAMLGIPAVSLDIREYYKEAGKPLKNMEIRASFDEKVYELIKPFNADVILLAGYVWATTGIIVDNYLVVGLHPGDLSVQDELGNRIFAGADGVGSTLSAGWGTICSSAYLATASIDGGPVLMLSPDISIDYSMEQDPQELRKFYLKQVNGHNRLLAAQVINEIARGSFAYDNMGQLLFMEKPIPWGHKLKGWLQDEVEKYIGIKRMLEPGSVVVVGASAKGGIGCSIVNNIVRGGYKGKVWVVNRNGDNIGGVSGYKDVAELPEVPDLAVITAPSTAVHDIAESCGRKGVRAVVCITAGFRETGMQGAENEEKLGEIIKRYGMRMLGPNCMGVLNTAPEVSLNAAMLKHTAKKGNIALITQSGALGAVMLDYAEFIGLGFSVVASLGNQADITAADLMSYLLEEEATQVVLMYLENIAEPQRFARIAGKLSETKTVIVLKAGRSEEGANAASSHTGSMTGSDMVMGALMEKSGIIRAETLEEAYYMALAASKNKKLKGRRIGVVTNAGGPGILATDRLSERGFQLSQLDASDKEHLRGILLPEASVNNPIDIVAPAPPEHYAEALSVVMNSGQYDAAAVICVPPSTVDTGSIAKAIVPVIKSGELPVICCFMGPTLGNPANEVLREAEIAIVDYPEKIADLMAKMVDKQLPDMCNGSSITSDPSERHKARKYMKKTNCSGYLPSLNVFRILEGYGFNVPRYQLIRDLEDLEHINLRFPVVAKIEHRNIVHKSDLGGVVLGIYNGQKLRDVALELFSHFPDAEGILLQEQKEFTGPELILGGKYEY
ncbi:MAG TPA: CoA-binding protein, partial [Negativicutes bacterium]|nr:CoA-binding protein [Negativicutes bacterium]